MKILGEELRELGRWYMALPPLLLIGFLIGLFFLGAAGQTRLNAANDRVQIMRGEQASESWPLSGQKPRVVGGVARQMPKLATIVSKERFAHPERGKSEQVDGRLDWEPPQVGTSARASSLGEAVMFTKEGLVIHGPALKRPEHENYPHLCLELPAATARRLYSRSFIGTRVMIKP